MEAFDLDRLKTERAHHGDAYLEFLRVPSLSAGLYELPIGGIDPQQPHSEDEIYYVIRGQATIRVGDDDRPVMSGSIIFVPAGIDHRFHSILDDLTILVVFAPAEYSQRAE